VDDGEFLAVFLFWMKKAMAAYIGMDYERGLLMLKDLVETGSVPSSLEFPGCEPSPSFVGVGIKRKISMDDIEEDMEVHYQEVRKHYPEGVGFSTYEKFNVVKKEMVYLIGVQLEKTPGVIPDGMELVNKPGMEVYVVRHRGCYRHLGNGWSAGMMHGRAKKFKHSKKFPPFEIYEDENEEEPVVKICLPMK
jgi:predicted transcriptional regulator YdeE